eukprot:9373166-Pyramimonas_sp.AAC.1
MGPSKDTQSWKRIEDRVAMSSSVDAEEFDLVAIFVQLPRVRVGGTPYLCTPLQLDQHEMATMNAKSRANYCSGLCSISMQDELVSACVAEPPAPGMSATDRNADPLRGRVGTNLAGVLLSVIGIAFVERNLDRAVA